MSVLDLRFRLCVVFLVFILIASACSEGGNANTDSNAASSEQVEVVDSQVAFIYPESVDEYNMSRLHEIGRQYLDEKTARRGHQICRRGIGRRR